MLKKLTVSSLMAENYVYVGASKADMMALAPYTIVVTLK